TTTSLQLVAPTTLTLTFAHEVEVRSLKVFGAKALSIQLGGQAAQTLDGAGRWGQAAQIQTGKLSQTTVTLAPNAASSRLAELGPCRAGALGRGAGERPSRRQRPRARFRGWLPAALRQRLRGCEQLAGCRAGAHRPGWSDDLRLVRLQHHAAVAGGAPRVLRL